MPKAFKLTAPKPFIPKEYDEQVAIFEWASYQKDPRLKLMFASLGGIRLPMGLAVKAKQAGNKQGVPDIFLPAVRRCPDGNILFCGLAIELKRIKASPSDTQPWQLAYHEELRGQCWRVEVCKGAKAAIAVIEEYLS